MRRGLRQEELRNVLLVVVVRMRRVAAAVVVLVFAVGRRLHAHASWRPTCPLAARMNSLKMTPNHNLQQRVNCVTTAHVSCSFLVATANDGSNKCDEDDDEEETRQCDAEDGASTHAACADRSFNLCCD